MRAPSSCTALISGKVKSASHSSPYPNWLPTWEYVPMPLGSSSLAPVISPGPSRCRKPTKPLRVAGSLDDAFFVLILLDRKDIRFQAEHPPMAYCPGHNLAAVGAVVTTGRRVWPADTVTDRMRQECHRE